MLTLAGALLLISPAAPSDDAADRQPWASGSPLQSIVAALALGYSIPTTRGVEIKYFAMHIGAALLLLLLGARAYMSRRPAPMRRHWREPWLAAQLLLVGWVLLSTLSALWSGAPQLSLGQAALYAFGLAWALGLAWCIERRHLNVALGALISVSVACAILTVWYYYERNPGHRPGFPLGNPGIVGSVLAPALLLCANESFTAARRLLSGDRTSAAPLAACAAALIPLAWAFILADALAAKIGLLAGAALLLFFQAAPRVRWTAIVLGLGLATVAVAWRLQQGADLPLARAASARFRLYAWRYAAELWGQSQYLGVGAGNYPRLATALSANDELLDPAAFMGDWRAAAHNELFEVLAEIGLVGGVTYVAGLVATFAVIWRLVRDSRAGPTRRLAAALGAGFVAMYVDSLGSAVLRLPGAPAMFFTCIGLIWMLGRDANRGDGMTEALDDFASPRRPLPRWPRALRVVMFLACATAAIGAVWLAVRDYSGARNAYRARAALVAGDADRAQALAELGRVELLEPKGRLLAQEQAMQSARRGARTAVWTYHSAPDKSANTLSLATGRLEQLFQAAREFDAFAPRLGDAQTFAAEAAETLHGLYQSVGDQPAAQKWRITAHQAWLWRRLHFRTDPRALLALTRYPADTADFQATLLRDALRGRDGRVTGVDGPAGDRPLQTFNREWSQSLRRLLLQPNFANAVEQLRRATSPIEPRTDLDTIVDTLAPEMHRLAAAVYALRGDLNGAAVQAGEAAALYESVRSRLPEWESAALAEQASYVFRESPTAPADAITLQRLAIDRLPAVSPDRLRAYAAPHRLRLAGYLLAQDRVVEATDVLSTIDPAPTLADAYLTIAEMVVADGSSGLQWADTWVEQAVTHQPGNQEAWERWLRLAALQRDIAKLNDRFRAAEAAGIAPDQLRQIASQLERDYPWLPSQRPTTQP